MNLNPFSKSFWVTTEQDVLDLIAKAKAGIAVAEKDIKYALKWFADHAGDITAAVQMIERAVVGSGLALSPEVTAAIAAANVAVAGLNAYAASVQAGGGTPTVQNVVDGYVAAKQAQASAAHAAATLAKQ